MTDAPERIWEPDAIYLTEIDWEDPDYPLVWASITEHSGGTEYRRADIPRLEDAARIRELEGALSAIRSVPRSEAAFAVIQLLAKEALSAMKDTTP